MRAYTTIDWNQVRSRIKEAEEKLAASMQPDEQKIKAIFDQRAKLLADRRTNRQEIDTATAYLVVRVGDAPFALEMKSVAEIGPLGRITKVPGVVPEVCGVFVHGGEIRGVVDLGVLLGLPADEQTSGYFVHIRSRQAALCFFVQSLVQTIRLNEGDITSSSEDSDLISGFTRERIAVLRIEALFTKALAQVTGSEATCDADSTSIASDYQDSRLNREVCKS